MLRFERQHGPARLAVWRVPQSRATAFAEVGARNAACLKSRRLVRRRALQHRHEAENCTGLDSWLPRACCRKPTARIGESSLQRFASKPHRGRFSRWRASPLLLHLPPAKHIFLRRCEQATLYRDGRESSLARSPHRGEATAALERAPTTPDRVLQGKGQPSGPIARGLT